MPLCYPSIEELRYHESAHSLGTKVRTIQPSLTFISPEVDGISIITSWYRSRTGQDLGRSFLSSTSLREIPLLSFFLSSFVPSFLKLGVIFDFGLL